MRSYRFRLKDIINNYLHSVVIPKYDAEGKLVKDKEKILRKLKKGEFKIV